MKIGLVQMRMVDDRSKNVESALHYIKNAAHKGANIVCLPELFDSKYFPQVRAGTHDVMAESIPGKTTKILSDSAKQNKVVLVGGSIYEKAGGRRYNTSVVFDENGKVLGKYRKVHIPYDESFYEQDYFSAGKDYPVFETKYGKIGVLICFDQWYPEAARIMRLNGAQIVFYPTAIGRVRGIEQVEGNWKRAWEGVQRGHAIANSLVVAAVNRVAKEGNMNFWGSSFVYDQFGKLLVRAGVQEGISMTECDLSLQNNVEDGWGFLRNRRPRSYSRITK